MTVPIAGEQRFSFGYHLNSWDLGGLELETGAADSSHPRVRRGFEALARDGFSNDFARRFMRAGEVDPPEIATATAGSPASRCSPASRRSSAYACRRSTATRSRSTAAPGQRARRLAAIGRVLAGFGSPVVVIGGGPARTRRAPARRRRARTVRRALGEIGAIAGELGRGRLPPAPRLFVETREELDRVMERLDTSPLRPLHRPCAPRQLRRRPGRDHPRVRQRVR